MTAPDTLNERLTAAGGLLEFTAYGKPITQGSKTRTRWGMHDDNADTLKPWRNTVSSAALDLLGDPLPAPLAGPVMVRLRFAMPKPASAPKTRRTWPVKARSGDIDKLARAVLDALTDVGVWGDDSQVVWLAASKDYAGTDGYLDRPGVRIGLLAVGDHQP